MRHRLLFAVSLVAAATALPALAPPAITVLSGAPGMRTAASVASARTCTQLQAAATRHDASGMESTTYELGHGTVTVSTPDPGFSAAAASPAERAATGIGTLPETARRLAEASGMRYDPSGSLCLGSQVASPVSATSSNWAGVALYAKGRHDAFWQAAASWTVPGFTSSCGPFSDHSMWTGVGGFSGRGGLMQDGIDTVIGDGVSDPDAVFAWWEVLDFPGTIEPMVKVPLAVHAGDDVTILTEYLAAQDRVIFWFLDRTTGATSCTP